MFRKVDRPRWKPQRTIYIFYWFLLSYVISALVFWYFELDKQNEELAAYKISSLSKTGIVYEEALDQIERDKSRKTAQYAGEGITFLLLIIAGAVLVFRLIRRQFVLSRQQQNFMMAVTHELKTPIAVTRLNLETLMRRNLPEEKQKMLITKSVQETNRLNALCNNMLMLSQLDAGGFRIEPEVFDLNTLVKEAADELRSRFPGRTFSVSLPESATVHGDRFLLQLALNNLIENAVKYSAATDNVHLEVGEDPGNVYLRVADTGPGIKDKEKKQVFKKHFRGDKIRTKGTGLGLYLTSRIVQYHHGKITLQDNRPAGSIFTIYLKKYDE